MTRIEELDAFLTRAQVFFMSTVRADGSPACRPLGLHILKDGNIRFGVGDFKAVYREMRHEPRVTICACAGREFIRYDGRAVFDDDEAMVSAVLDAAPHLRQIYNEETGYKLVLFHLEDAVVEYHDLATLTARYEL